MIQINKQLQRLDGGVVPSGSIIDYRYLLIDSSEQIIFRLKHSFNQAAKDDSKPFIVGVEDFSYKLTKTFTSNEWADLGAADPTDEATMIEGWLKEIIDGLIGVGYTEII